MIISKVEAGEKILDYFKKRDGRFFYTEHEKKDGSLRKTIARFGVKKGLKGKGLRFNPEEKKVVNVHDMVLLDFRSINLETLRKLHMEGNKFEVQ